MDRENAFEERMAGNEIPMPQNASNALWQVLRKALAFQVDGRYQNASEFKKALQSLSFQSASVKTIPIDTTKRRDGRKRQWGILILIFSIAFITAFVLRKKQTVSDIGAITTSDTITAKSVDLSDLAGFVFIKGGVQKWVNKDKFKTSLAEAVNGSDDTWDENIDYMADAFAQQLHFDKDMSDLHEGDTLTMTFEPDQKFEEKRQLMGIELIFHDFQLTFDGN